jgi:MoaA/NifB/PqqE/SkfB family radical SAM enzyme
MPDKLAPTLEEKEKKIHPSMGSKILPLSGRCNNSCLFCGASSDYPHLGLPAIKSEIDLAREKGYESIVLTGGEPTIHPDIISVVSYARTKGFREIRIVTNGRMFYYPTFTRDIIKAGLNEVAFSIHGPTPEIHDAHTGSKGSFTQLMGGIKNAAGHKGLVIGADTTITRLNYKYLPDTIRLIISLGIKSDINIIGLWLFSKAFSNRETIMPDYNLVRPHLIKAISLCHQENAQFFLVNVPPEYLEGYETYLPERHASAHDLGHYFDQFKDRQTPLCKGVRCPYCELEGFCERLSAVLNDIKLKKKPELARIDIGESCSNSCSFCLRKRDKKPISLETMHKELSLLRKYGATRLEITGGEPTLNPDLIGLVSLANKEGFSVITIKTDGRKLTKEYAESLKEAGATRLLISIHSSDEKIHDQLTGVKGSFRETLAGIDAAGPIFPIDTNTVITRLNYDSLPKLATLLKGKGIKKANFLLLNPFPLIRRRNELGAGRYYAEPDLAASLGKIAPYLEKSASILKERLIVRDVPNCHFRGSINSSGDFVLESSLLSENFPEQFSNLAISLLRKSKLKKPGCASCLFSSSCDGLYYEHVRLYGFDELRPVSGEKPN